MKTNFSVLLMAALMATLWGCESKSFKAERQMWKANKKAQAVFRNPKAAPPFEVAAAVKAFEDIIAQYPDSLFAVQARNTVGNMYLVKGEYEKARAEYAKLSTQCDKRGPLCAEAQFSIARAYEVEGKDDEAMKRMKQILKDYPLTRKSVEIPLYLIAYNKRLKKPLQPAVDEAVAHYLTLKSRPETEKAAYVFESLIVRAYLEGLKWNDAIDALEKMTRDYPDRAPDQALFMKASIYARFLNDKEKSKSELERLIKEYPKSPLVKSAEEVLAKFSEKAKKDNV